MLASLFQFLINLVGSVLGALLLLRAWLYVWAMSPRHPLVQLCRRTTDWLCEPLSKVLKPRGALDYPALLATLIVAFVLVLILREATGMPATPLGVVIAPFAMVLRWALEMISWGAFIWVIMSWLNPTHPMCYTLGTLLDPFVRPIRRVLPTIASFDFSPVVVILLANIGLMFVTPLSAGYVML